MRDAVWLCPCRGILQFALLVVCVVNPVNLQEVPISDSVCADNGCFKPSYCAPDCFAAFQSTGVNSSFVTVHLRSPTGNPDYVAFGLSKSGRMTDASIMACLNDGSGTITLGHYYNAASGRSSTRVTDPLLGLRLVDSGVDGGQIHCIFERDVQISSNTGQVFPLDADYTLLLADGPTSGSALNTHTGRGASDATLNIVTISGQVSAAEDSAASKKAHACLMITAWVLFAGSGIILARFYKENWAERKLCKVVVWFAMHRACMVMALVTTAVAFIVIFVDVNGYSEFGADAEGYMKAHPPLGIVVMILVLTNPIMALFRPHPDEKRRPIFNWAHWAVGTSAHIVAVITIFFGMTLNITETFAPIELRYVMAGYTAFHGLSFLGLEIARWVSVREEKKVENTMEMQHNGVAGDSSADESACGTTFRAAFLGIYCTVVFGLWLAMILLIAL